MSMVTLSLYHLLWRSGAERVGDVRKVDDRLVIAQEAVDARTVEQVRHFLADGQVPLVHTVHAQHVEPGLRGPSTRPNPGGPRHP